MAKTSKVTTVKKTNTATQKTNKPSQGIAIAALLLNVLIFPGLGTIVGGKTKTGIIQIVLFVVSIPLWLILIGIPLSMGVWIWALVSGIQLLKEAE